MNEEVLSQSAKKRVYVRITCDTGNTWVTGFNGTMNAAIGYFFGQVFTRELEDGTEINETVTCVEEV